MATPIHDPTDGRRTGPGGQPSSSLPAGSTGVRDPARRERILNAAADLMARRGYLGVNLGDIGAAAGIVGSGIYRHFDSKIAILVEMFDRVVDRLLADADTCLRTSADPHATLIALVRGQVRFTIDEHTLCQVYLQEARSLPASDLRRLRWKQRHYIDLWQEVLATVRPELPPEHAQVLVHAAISVIHSILHHHNDLDAAETADILQAAACRTLGIEPR